MSYYPYPNNMHRNSSYGIPQYQGQFAQGRASEIMNFQCPTDGITPCEHPGDPPRYHASWPTSWCNGSGMFTSPNNPKTIYCNNLVARYEQNVLAYQQYENARKQQLLQAKQRAAAVQQKAKLDKALIKECKAGNQDACFQLKKMGFKGLAGISPFAYGAVTPASDEEKGRNLQLFVGAMGLLFLGTLVFGAKGK